MQYFLLGTKLINASSTKFQSLCHKVSRSLLYELLQYEYYVLADCFDQVNKITIEGPTVSWLMRKLMKRTSSAQTKIKTERHLRQKRSVSDITLRLRTKKDSLKGKHLDDLARLCGSSALYLPSDFAARTLSVPTCFRATAQYLVQHGNLLYLIH
jgi:hypothetical protein